MLSSHLQLINKNIGSSTTISSLPYGADAYEISKLLEHITVPLLIITRDDKRQEQLQNQINFFEPNTHIINLPAWDSLPYDRISPSIYTATKRVKALCQISRLNELPLKTKIVIITSVNSILQKIPPLDILNEHSIYLRKGNKVDREKLLSNLCKSGYLRNPTATEPGEFAVRGSIIDIIPSGQNLGYRIDFFAEEIESIRIFDPLTQISNKQVEELSLIPTSEVILNPETIANFRELYRENFTVINRDDPLYEAISEGRHYAGMENYLPFFYPELKSLFAYLPNALICFDYLTVQAKDERIATIQDYYLARKNPISKDSHSYNPVEPELLYLTEKSYIQEIAKYPNFTLSPFAIEPSEHNVLLKYSATSNILTTAKTNQVNVFEYLKDYIETKKEQIRKHENNLGLKTIIACLSNGSRDRLDNILKEHNFNTVYVEDWDTRKIVSGKTIGLVILEIESGFIGQNILLISEQDLFGEKIGSKKARSKQSDRFFLEATHLNEGEYVVHKEHGIGKFEALETLVILGQKHDCLRIIYQNNDKFYLPVENIDAIKRYSSESEEVKLDKLGSLGWQDRKAKMKKRIKDIAFALLKIAAARKLTKATIIENNDKSYEEFCAGFPYVETEDQLKAINDVKEDLASGQVMDRLICGDVGFGKTEVALRAAFIVASNQKPLQVAVIAPTTLLARQHLKTFKERFANFPFNIAGLSRFTESKDAKLAKKGIEDGSVDIIIGTHALLAKSLKFKNLGLLIIDEEQLFGVTQKEQLKELQKNIHILTLSATPIPRTLQMSLAGIKELSLITTPPVDRLAIRSYIMPFDDVIIRNAILREYYRGGKCFVVLPKIKDLEKMREHLSHIVPEVNLITAHGQVAPSILDDTMNKFYDGKYDVLIATNIIGSGLDLATANTIIIHKAELFGLAQLYQMRGRVGRSKVRAYAYFTTDARKQLSKLALKRLDVMQSLDTLGAGFTLSSHDMDIRGFGNLLGDEQSGHVKEVGIELYQEMLEEAINSAKLDKDDIEEKDFTPHINLNIPVLIPDNFVPDIELRLGLYRRIAAQKTERELEEISIELIDRFGKLPEEVINLIEIMKLKLLAFEAGIEKIDSGPKGFVISFYQNKFKNPENIIEYVHKNPTTSKLRGDQKLILLNENKDKSFSLLRNAISILLKMK